MRQKRTGTAENKTRVLIVENGAGFGGALSSLATLVHALPPERWDVHLITSYPQTAILQEGAVSRVNVLPRERRYGSQSPLETGLKRILGKRAGNAAFLIDHLTTGRTYAHMIARYIREHGIELVHCNNGVLINDAVVMGAKKAGVPCVVHARADEYPGKVSSWFARHVQAFMPVSAFVAASVRELGVASAKITIVPEGLDCAEFASRAQEKAFRRAANIPFDVPLVGMVGCLVGWKGHGVFLDACKQIFAATSAVAVVVGDSPLQAPERLAQLKEQARQLGIADRIIFTGHRSDIPSVMAACDVVVHASTAPEPFGRVLLEAMAVGTSVVATDAGGPAEVVTDHLDGMLIPPSDAEAMAEAVIFLLRHEAERLAMGKAGQATCHQYSMERHVELVTGVYRAVLTG